ncbi:hypothetical protein BB777_03575 [Planococcus faecalis]|nr:hypothetical protein BB777_03575 [Planococcus faecalis]
MVLVSLGGGGARAGAFLCSDSGLVEEFSRRSISRLRTLGHGSRNKPRSALVLLLRLAPVAPWLVLGRLSELTLFGLGSGCEFWIRLAAVVHAPTLLS